MYKIEVRGHFSAAHFLEDYDGLCGSVHGHRWEVVLSLKQPVKSDGMVVDFHDLKDSLNQIMDEMDHSFILDPCGNSVSRDFYRLAISHKMRVFEFTGRTTAENIAKHIYERIRLDTGYTTHAVTVYEAPGNGVTYSEE